MPKADTFDNEALRAKMLLSKRKKKQRRRLINSET